MIEITLPDNIKLPDYFDNNAVHVNRATEISGIVEKSIIASNDILIIEDSESDPLWSKKRIKASNLGLITAQNIGSGSQVYASGLNNILKFRTFSSSDQIVGIQLNPAQDEIVLSIDQSNIGINYIGDGTTFKKYLATERTKLSGIEPLADVTSYARVLALLGQMEVKAFSDISQDGSQIDSAAQTWHHQGTDTAIGPMGSNINFNSYRAINVGSPVLDGDAINLAYFNSHSGTGYDAEAIHIDKQAEIQQLPTALSLSNSDVFIYERYKDFPGQEWQKYKIDLFTLRDTVNTVHTNISNEFVRAPSITTLASNDLFLVEQNVDGVYNKSSIFASDVLKNANDSDAFHQHIDGEIISLPRKVPPFNNDDVVMIESSSNSFQKMSVYFSDLIGGGGTDLKAIHYDGINEFDNIVYSDTPNEYDFLIMEIGYGYENTGEKRKVHYSDLVATTDIKAIHYDGFNEFNPILEKVAPDIDDWILLELGNVSGTPGLKRKFKFSNIPAAHDAKAIHYDGIDEFSNIVEESVLNHDDFLIAELGTTSGTPGEKRKFKFSAIPSAHDPKAIHYDGVNEFSSVPYEFSAAPTDLFLLENSAGEKRKITFNSIPTAHDAKAIHYDGIKEFDPIQVLNYQMFNQPYGSYVLLESDKDFSDDTTTYPKGTKFKLPIDQFPHLEYYGKNVGGKHQICDEATDPSNPGAIKFKTMNVHSPLTFNPHDEYFDLFIDMVQLGKDIVDKIHLNLDQIDDGTWYTRVSKAHLVILDAGAAAGAAALVDVTGLDITVGEMEGEIGTIQGQIEEIDTTLGELQTSVETNEGNITENKDAIQVIQDEYVKKLENIAVTELNSSKGSIYENTEEGIANLREIYIPDEVDVTSVLMLTNNADGLSLKAGNILIDIENHTVEDSFGLFDKIENYNNNTSLKKALFKPLLAGTNIKIESIDNALKISTGKYFSEDPVNTGYEPEKGIARILIPVEDEDTKLFFRSIGPSTDQKFLDRIIFKEEGAGDDRIVTAIPTLVVLTSDDKAENSETIVFDITSSEEEMTLDYKLNNIKGGTGITVALSENEPREIVISSTGETIKIENIGDGTGIYKAFNENEKQYEFKSLSFAYHGESEGNDFLAFSVSPEGEDSVIINVPYIANLTDKNLVGSEILEIGRFETDKNSDLGLQLRSLGVRQEDAKTLFLEYSQSEETIYLMGTYPAITYIDETQNIFNYKLVEEVIEYDEQDRLAKIKTKYMVRGNLCYVDHSAFTDGNPLKINFNYIIQASGGWDPIYYNSPVITVENQDNDKAEKKIIFRPIYSTDVSQKYRELIFDHAPCVYSLINDDVDGAQRLRGLTFVLPSTKFYPLSDGGYFTYMNFEPYAEQGRYVKGGIGATSKKKSGGKQIAEFLINQGKGELADFIVTVLKGSILVAALLEPNYNETKHIPLEDLEVSPVYTYKGSKDWDNSEIDVRDVGTELAMMYVGIKNTSSDEILSLATSTVNNDFPNDTIVIELDPTKITRLGTQSQDLDMGNLAINNLATAQSTDNLNAVNVSLLKSYVEEEIADIKALAHEKDHDDGTDPIAEDLDLGGDPNQITGEPRLVVPHKIINQASPDFDVDTDGVNVWGLKNYSGVKDAFHSNEDSEFVNLPIKANVLSGDWIVLEDSEDGFKKKKASLASAGDIDAIHLDKSHEISQLVEKIHIQDSDIVIIEDSEDDFNKKKVEFETFSGGIKKITSPINYFLSQSECRNLVLSNYGQTNDVIYLFPRAQGNLNVRFQVDKFTLSTINTNMTINILFNIEDYFFLNNEIADNIEDIGISLRLEPASSGSFVEMFSISREDNSYGWNIKTTSMHGNNFYWELIKHPRNTFFLQSVGNGLPSIESKMAILEYDGSFSYKLDFFDYRTFGTSFANIGNQMYLFGGYKENRTKVDSIGIYDLSTNTFSTSTTSVYYARIAANGVSFAKEGMGFVVGGIEGENIIGLISTFDFITKDVVFAWHHLLDGTCRSSCIKLGSMIFIFCGITGLYTISTTNKVILFDTISKIETLQPEYLHSVQNLSGVEYNGYLYNFFGDIRHYGDTFYAYSLAESGSLVNYISKYDFLLKTYDTINNSVIGPTNYFSITKNSYGFTLSPGIIDSFTVSDSFFKKHDVLLGSWSFVNEGSQYACTASNECVS